MPKTMYKETIGTATIEMLDNGTDYTVKLNDGDLNAKLDFISYDAAINAYDKIVQHAATIHNVTPSTIGKPDFVSTIQ